MKFKFRMYLTMISALAFLTVDLSEVQAQLESYGCAAPAACMTTAVPAPVCCGGTANLVPVNQTGLIPSYRNVQYARKNPGKSVSPYSENMVAAPVTHRGMTYVPMFPRSTQRSFFRFRRDAGVNGYGY